MKTTRSARKKKPAAHTRKDVDASETTNEADQAPAVRPKSVAGTYVYDPELDRIVKVSNRIPGVAAKANRGLGEGGNEGEFGGESGCNRTECGGGSCAMPEGGFD